MNFTYYLTKPPDGQWGSVSPDGSWSGMVGQLKRGEVDFSKKISIFIMTTFIRVKFWFSAPTDFTVTLARAQVMTFLVPITEYYHALFIKNPSETYNLMAYIEPLHWLAWGFILGFIFLAPPFLWITTRYSSNERFRSILIAKGQVDNDRLHNSEPERAVFFVSVTIFLKKAMIR